MNGLYKVKIITPLGGSPNFPPNLSCDGGMWGGGGAKAPAKIFEIEALNNAILDPIFSIVGAKFL